MKINFAVKPAQMAKLTQEELLQIFRKVKSVMQPYEQGNIVAQMNIEGKYDLWSHKPGMVIMGKPRPAINFVTIIIQSGYVGFYYMPIYTQNPALVAKMPPALMKLLKGKACFHLKTMDDALLQDVATAMKAGYDAYKKMGWI